MLEALPEADPADLLVDVPLGDYLLEQADGWLILWRLSEGEPSDDALEPAADWALVTA
jgi:hypothetical protein